MVIDDFGNAVAYQRRCTHCRRWLPLNLDHFFVNADRKRPLGLGTECRGCDRDRHRLRLRALAAEPARRREQLEGRRLAARLLREQRGETLRPVARAPQVYTWRTDGGYLPVAPLVAALDRWLNGRDDHHAETFVVARNLLDWREGRVEGVKFDVADRVLIGIDLLWWEVWGEGVEGHERAAELFTGEKVAA